MATSSALSLFLHLILFFFFFFLTFSTLQASFGYDNAPDDPLHLIEVTSITPAHHCTKLGPVRQTPGVVGLPLAHRHGPCSPIFHEQPPSMYYRSVLHKDRMRVASLNGFSLKRKTPRRSLLIDGGSNAQLPITSSSEFVVTVGLGTPMLDLVLIFDTGSDISWTQCQPCSSTLCYPQQGQMFDPSNSSTFSKPPCSTSSCSYSIDYADGSHSNGYYGQDTLTLTPEYVFPKFLFGCGQNNSDGYGGAAGVLGLGQGATTLISATQSEFASIFCYCIPPTESSTGYLLFGLKALEVCQTSTFTPLITDPSRPSLYFVNLLGITVGTKSITMPSSMKSRAIIDSGTMITRLPPSVYSVVQAEFKNLMKDYPAVPGSDLLDTCYDLSKYQNATIPKLVLNFENCKVPLDPSAAIWTESDSKFCLAFSVNKNHDDLVIIGSAQQRNLNILYDIQDHKVEFGSGSCGE
ncbi:hypothetical protein MLD38_037990 [Melastoma candidum]|uniref:Uncharacterized protein n=1 Tax=Melastoma candidum TaxID=119954 RepID=A0ACB9KYN3_9MYRT|nr:hypothetical protein MLD38_037990 [Melastoma candidum]